MMDENVFRSLFSYRPRKGITPKENYLTEAFGYALRSSPEPVAVAWAAHLAGVKCTHISGAVEVRTQEPVAGPDGRAVVDMVLGFSLTDGRHLTVLSEHKWDSATNVRQLRRYREIASSLSEGILVFLAPTAVQIAEARPFCSKERALLWEEAYSTLLPFAETGSILDQFLRFLMQEGLGPHEPLSLSMLSAYTHSFGVEDGCHRLSQRLIEQDWSLLPKRFKEPEVYCSRPKYGRMGIGFNDDKWNPLLLLGFLLDPTDHKLELCTPKKGIDLMLIIDAEQKVRVKGTALAKKADGMRQRFTEAKVEEGDELRNKWRKLVVRQPLADVIQGHPTEDDQVDVIYERFKAWCECLFNDGKLERAFAGTNWG